MIYKDLYRYDSCLHFNISGVRLQQYLIENLGKLIHKITQHERNNRLYGVFNRGNKFEENKRNL